MRRVEPLADEWNEAAGQGLRRARVARGHRQADCARELQEMARQRVDQSLVSKWEHAVNRPSTRALREAIDQYVGATTAPDEPVQPDASGAAKSEEEQDDFDALVAHAVGEPLLGPTQIDLANSLAHRLKHGPKMSAHDADIARELARAIRLFPG